VPLPKGEQAVAGYYGLLRTWELTTVTMISKAKRQRLFLRDGHTCQICGKVEPDVKKLTMDHVVPKSQHGTNADANLRTAHRTCNGRRGTPGVVFDAKKPESGWYECPNGEYAIVTRLNHGREVVSRRWWVGICGSDEFALNSRVQLTPLAAVKSRLLGAKKLDVPAKGFSRVEVWWVYDY